MKYDGILNDNSKYKYYANVNEDFTIYFNEEGDFRIYQYGIYSTDLNILMDFINEPKDVLQLLNIPIDPEDEKTFNEIIWNIIENVRNN